MTRREGGAPDGQAVEGGAAGEEARGGSGDGCHVLVGTIELRSLECGPTVAEIVILSPMMRCTLGPRL